MQYQWFVFWSGLFDWLIFSVSLFVIADKLGWQKKRDAWVPGLRIYRLGESVHMNFRCKVFRQYLSFKKITQQEAQPAHVLLNGFKAEAGKCFQITIADGQIDCHRILYAFLRKIVQKDEAVLE